MNIEVIDITESEEPAKNGKGKNKTLTVSYKTEEGKIEGKKLYDWATAKDVWTSLVTTQKGATLNIGKDKNDKGFWEWKEVHRQDGPMKVTPVPTKPTYETPDERAHKQVMIVRQSSISSAVNLLGTKASAEQVIEVAKRFESYVMGNSIHDITNDIPN